MLTLQKRLCDYSGILYNSEQPLHALERSLVERRTISLPRTEGTELKKSHLGSNDLLNHVVTDR